MNETWRRSADSWNGLPAPADLPAPPDVPDLRRLTEDFRLEAPQSGAVFPRVARQAGFVTGLREKRFRVPVEFGRDLGQQKTPLPAILHHEAMATDGDVGRTGNRLERAEQRDLDVDLGELDVRDRRKAR